MADLTITAANVASSSGAAIEYGTAGASFTAGQTSYKDPATNTYKLADANLSLTAATVYGIALNGAASGQPIAIQTGGDITIGATITVGGVYVQSATAGGIAPVADLTTGWYTTVLLIGKTASIGTIVNRTAGVAVP